MTRRILLSLWLLSSVGLLHAQEHPYRVVFDLTSTDSLNQRSVVRWISLITSSHPDAELEVVMYGSGFELVMPGKSHFIEEVKTAMKNPRVSFKACQIALRGHHVDKSQLLEGAQTVPDGIYEIVSKQQDGWAYIKVVR